ncbi:hypothetical protein HF086_007664 [Spodoptera exigua]|uniref:MADF domain-containing protein n=1 Tax=Spodoptera exigua TaxID=7107 RepID=A0A922M7E0_SPOEX|nr:hypothetical protein HF086_007664 [Spodoptera exigua]
MIATDNQPISILENKCFDKLLHSLKPKYKLPGRKYMSEVVIPAIYESVKKIIKDEISKANAVSITSDMWTCLNNMLSFLSFNAHWLSEDFVLQHRVLQMKNFVGSHSGDHIRSLLEELASTWDISSLIHVIVRDNGPNMVKAIRESAFEGKGCFIHTLQLALKAVLEFENVNDALISARRIVTHFNHSSTAQQKLKDIQKELHLAEHQLVQDNEIFAQENYELVRRKLFLEAIQKSDPDAESSSEDVATKLNRGRPPQNVSNFLGVINKLGLKEKLIEEVRKYPLLYDLRDPKYSDVHKKEKAWNEIAIVLSQPNFIKWAREHGFSYDGNTLTGSRRRRVTGKQKTPVDSSKTGHATAPSTSKRTS